jgi:F0F1-type ATP synthase membrane subunit b/b'
METLVAPTINLLCLLGFLAYYLRKPAKDFAKNRSVSIRGELEKVREELRIAQEKHREFSSKLKAMDAEVAALKNQAIQDAQAMKGRISAEAQKMAANIVSDARSASVVLYTEFKDQLYSELGLRVLDRAEKILSERLTGDDRARIRKEFATQVGATQ